MLTTIQDTLTADSPTVELPAYDPSALTAGIAHIGVGNFHRAHEAYYTHQLLNQLPDANWGIRGISITGSGPATAAQFAQQDNLYTLTEFSADGDANVAVIGSIVDYIAAQDDAEAALEALADPAIKIISLTITEGGYKLAANRSFQLDDADVQHDLHHPTEPKTAFGYVVEALARRKQRGSGPVTILSCDNLQHNGDAARTAFLAFAAARDAELADWIGQHVSFPNSMVDRITPATHRADRQRLNAQSGIDDALPVYCEDFTQWIIEDEFAAGRPAWEQAGVLFVDDVTPYETVKLRLLNAAHSMLAYPAFLAGFRTVHEVMQDDLFRTYLYRFLQQTARSLTAEAQVIDLDDYIDQLMSRFSNEAVGDQLARLCGDGASKWPVFVLPTLLDHLQHGRDTACLAFGLAAYGHYLQAGIDDKGKKYTVVEPHLTGADWANIRHQDSTCLLTTTPFASADLRAYPTFLAQYRSYRSQLARYGLIFSLKQTRCILQTSEAA